MRDSATVTILDVAVLVIVGICDTVMLTATKVICGC